MQPGHAWRQLGGWFQHRRHVCGGPQTIHTGVRPQPLFPAAAARALQVQQPSPLLTLRPHYFHALQVKARPEDASCFIRTKGWLEVRSCPWDICSMVCVQAQPCYVILPSCVINCRDAGVSHMFQHWCFLEGDRRSVGGRRKNVIVSPHVYCPSVTFAKFSISGKSMYARLNRSFGFYNRLVRCSSSPSRSYWCLHTQHQPSFGSDCIHPRCIGSSHSHANVTQNDIRFHLRCGWPYVLTNDCPLFLGPGESTMLESNDTE